MSRKNGSRQIRDVVGGGMVVQEGVYALGAELGLVGLVAAAGGDGGHAAGALGQKVSSCELNGFRFLGQRLFGLSFFERNRGSVAGEC